VKEFSKNAKNYEEYNIIQKKVAKKVVSLIDRDCKTILDLGCGSGGIYKCIDWRLDNFVGIDSSKNMCSLHPKGENVEIINMDYEKDIVYDELLKKRKFDIVCSSSSLQWCNKLSQTVKNFSKLSDKCAVSIFCDKTFKTIYDISGLDRFLPDFKEVVEIFSNHYDIEFQREFYKLYFEDNLSKFRYIKKSGVSGGVKRLSYKETKKLIENYPLDYLEFEVLYIKGSK